MKRASDGHCNVLKSLISHTQLVSNFTRPKYRRLIENIAAADFFNKTVATMSLFDIKHMQTIIIQSLFFSVVIICPGR